MRYEISSHILTPCLGFVVNTYTCSPLLFNKWFPTSVLICPYFSILVPISFPASVLRCLPISFLIFFLHHPASVLRTFFGSPLSRRRIFILMIRKDCLRDLEGMSLDDYILEKLRGMNQPVQHTWPLVSIHRGG